MGPNLDTLRTVERKRRKCYGCGRRRMTSQLIGQPEVALCSECLQERDRMLRVNSFSSAHLDDQGMFP